MLSPINATTSSKICFGWAMADAADKMLSSIKRNPDFMEFELLLILG
jgi:hypothetical protein